MLNEIAYRKKEVNSIQKELKKLERAKWNLGSYELEKPIRHGWYKHLRLRDDIARRKDCDAFQSIIDVAGLSVWGRNKKHVELVWTKENSSKEFIQFPGIMKLNQKEFDKLHPKAKAYFEGFEQYWTSWSGRVMRYYCRVPRYYFVMTYTKAYNTHRTIINPELERKISELDALILRDGYFEYSWNAGSYKDTWKGSFIQKRIRRKVKMTLMNYDDSIEMESWLYNDMVNKI